MTWFCITKDLAYLLLSISAAVLYVLSNKTRRDIQLPLILGCTNLGISLVLYFFMPEAPAFSQPYLSLIDTVSSIICLWCVLHWWILFEAARNPEVLYRAAGPCTLVAGIGGIGYEIAFVLRGHAWPKEILFCVLFVITGAFTIASHNWYKKITFFRYSGVLLVIACLAAVAAEPFVGENLAAENYLARFLESVARNTHFLYPVIFFFIYNMIRFDLLNHLNRHKLLAWVLSLCAGGWLYREPLGRDFVDKIPIFKEVLPPLAFVGVLFVLPLATLWDARPSNK